MSFNKHKTKQQKTFASEEKLIIRLTFNPGSALTGFRTIMPYFQQPGMTPRSNRKPALGQRSTLKKQSTSMSCKLEPAIWSRDTGQRIPCFDRCQLITTWMSNIREVHGKPKLHISINLLFEVWPPCCATPSSSSSSPSSNTASHDNHEKINSWVSFSFLYEYGAPLACLRHVGGDLTTPVKFYPYFRRVATFF